MTSQLVLGNASGIVLASDSAVTIHGGRTFDSCEKVYGLPAPHRLAVMLCGNALYYKIPIEVLVKEWISSLPDKAEESVGDYRSDFVSWIGNKGDRWQSTHNRDVAAWKALLGEVEGLTNWLKSNLDGAEEGESPTDLVLRLLRRTNEYLNERPAFVSSAVAESIIDDWWKPDDTLEKPRPGLKGEVDHHFVDIPRSETIEQEIRTYLRLVVEKADDFPNGGSSVLHFVGYGATDLLPTVARLELAGAMATTVWHYSDEPYRPHPAGPSHALIVSAAQDDIIKLVLKGWSPDLAQEATSGGLDSIWEMRDPNNPDHQDEESESPRLEDRHALFKSSLIEAVMGGYDHLVHDEYLGKTFATVAVMPVLDLAKAAKALVAVQALTLDIRGKLPSVGGHIDVASITVNEGFRWISHGEDG